MNWYVLRKLIYAAAGAAVGEALLAVGTYITSTPTDNLMLRQGLWIAGTATVAAIRRKFLPGWLGSQN
jgi:hypothetical protein